MHTRVYTYLRIYTGNIIPRTLNIDNTFKGIVNASHSDKSLEATIYLFTLSLYADNTSNLF